MQASARFPIGSCSDGANPHYPAKIQVPLWAPPSFAGSICIGNASSAFGVAASSPAKVANSGTLAAVILIEDYPGSFCKNPAACFQYPPGLQTVGGLGCNPELAAPKLSGDECYSEAETCCSGSDPGTNKDLNLGSSSESAASGPETAGVSLQTLSPVGSPSVGSSLHETGNCKPCAWYWKPTGCENGGQCQFCHMCTEGEVKNRKKSKLVAMRQARKNMTQDGVRRW